MITENAIDNWRQHPVTKELLRSLQDRLAELSAGLLDGREFRSVDPTREIYRTIGIIRLLEEVITLDIIDKHTEV